MEPFTTLDALVVPIDRANVDTDAILPKQYMKMIGRTGFGAYLFDEWRYLDTAEPGDDCTSRQLNLSFPLNQSRYEGSRILLGRTNFGCGSSREHAVWALSEWGIRAVIAPSFAEIFHGNCLKNGLLPITLPASAVDTLFQLIERSPGYGLVIDLQTQTVRTQDGTNHHFEIAPFSKTMLLEGLDEIGATSVHSEEIEAFECIRLTREPWLASGR